VKFVDKDFADSQMLSNAAVIPVTLYENEGYALKCIIQTGPNPTVDFSVRAKC
jgi:hypothetical protein